MKAGFVVCVTNVVPKFGSMFVVQRPGHQCSARSVDDQGCVFVLHGPGHQCSGSRIWRDPLADKLGK